MAPPLSSSARHISRRRLLATSAATAGALLVGSQARAQTQAVEASEKTWPGIIPLPNGFRPEGITIGGGPYAYLGSLGDGSIYRADLRTGQGGIISAGPGTPSVGLKLDGRGRLFVAGRGQGARVVDVRTGAILASYVLTTKTPTFANDVFLTQRAAWFTDSFQPALYALPLGRRGQLPDADDVVTVTLSGDWTQTPGEVVNANGITRTPDGKALLVVQSGAGGLHRVDPATGVTKYVDLGDAAPLTNGDGLLLLGRRLYVVQNRQNAIDVFRLAADGSRGVFENRITDAGFDVPTTVAAYQGRLYLPNARFTTTPTPDTAYAVVAVER
ncbi:twin-arginine translocation signal domain-containing protein [Streptomyces ipomoeae]|uniref:Tat pathway signal sequence domain protein n=2 Tax=Streptomyces ipomoeae TaxID=103232 RepID=L1KL72_9ACTN|nr:twin-arginine translocation signal domain-containing protein [Streptomyces ipomoeae]EKX61284.1 Tat pathway signal sequence domain protein [Streptomyces ipomoeae 91-03]MDX2696585.1 twin-arginine translocation signal domain-containing protein [Streptomyces ipomoeae]MDX2824112.1 twin-arginine translocation signal domain-containing protein [Streptomyces ipomoeae]MDX2842359.1 twin-arginine translocation signal domain-containing protein [Streptomyces ipomoeae]MDX2876670.1 twin-arginine translocat